MSTSIQFNNYSLQDNDIRVKDIIYRNLPEKIINLEPKIRRDGFRLINTYYSEKEIKVAGSVTKDTSAELKVKVDAMKEALHIDEANLDIDDGGTTIRWICSVKEINVPEQHYHITRIPFNISFVCQPFGKSITNTNDLKTITNASTSPYVNTINPVGSAPPLPTLKWTLDNIPTTPITQIVFANSTTGDSITVSSLALDATGDYLEINCDNMTVKVSHDGGSATSVDYSGVFPTFVTGSNSYSVTITGGGASWILNQDINYYSLYI